LDSGSSGKRRLDKTRDDLVQDRFRVRLEQVLKRRQVVDVLLFRDERQEPADGRLLRSVFTNRVKAR